jgi:hypothetical protein
MTSLALAIARMVGYVAAALPYLIASAVVASTLTLMRRQELNRIDGMGDIKLVASLALLGLVAQIGILLAVGLS